MTYNEAELKRLELEVETTWLDFVNADVGSAEEDVARKSLNIARENLNEYVVSAMCVVDEKTEPVMRFVDEKIEPTFTFDDDFGDMAAVSALDTQVDGDHYNKRAIQPVEFCYANGLNFIEGSIVKYITRWRDKGGVKDLNKIKHYVDLLIELENKYVKPT